MKFYAAIYHPMSAEDPECALDTSVRWVSPHRQKLIDWCVADLAAEWAAVKVVEQDTGDAHILAADGEFSTYYVVQAVDMLR